MGRYAPRLFRVRPYVKGKVHAVAWPQGGERSRDVLYGKRPVVPFPASRDEPDLSFEDARFGIPLVRRVGGAQAVQTLIGCELSFFRTSASGSSPLAICSGTEMRQVNPPDMALLRVPCGCEQPATNPKTRVRISVALFARSVIGSSVLNPYTDEAGAKQTTGEANLQIRGNLLPVRRADPMRLRQHSRPSCSGLLATARSKLRTTCFQFRASVTLPNDTYATCCSSSTRPACGVLTIDTGVKTVRRM